MRANRRTFHEMVGHCGSGGRCAQRAPTREPDAQGAATVPPSISALRPMTAGIVPITIDERRARIDKARRLMTEQRHRRHPRRGRLEHVLFHRRAVGPERAPVRRRHPGEGRARVGLPRLRGGAGARADQVRHRHPHLAGRREPVPRDRADLQGSRHRDRPHRRRGAAALLRHERRQERGAGARVRQRRSGHRRLPHDQVAGGDRADAARERHDDRRLQGRPRDAARGDDAGRSARATSWRPTPPSARRAPTSRSASASTRRSRTAASRRRS